MFDAFVVALATHPWASVPSDMDVFAGRKFIALGVTLLLLLMGGVAFYYKRNPPDYLESEDGRTPLERLDHQWALGRISLEEYQLRRMDITGEAPERSQWDQSPRGKHAAD